ncbi:MAG: YraN family protein [Verrucomicrobiota bacterium]
MNIKELFRWKVVCPDHTDTQTIGKFGEKAAACFLQERGYKILVRNYVSEYGEIDLVCRHKDTLVFVEVKARGESSSERPARAVDEEKRKKIRKTARAYVDELYVRDMPQRFDIVEVYLKQGCAPRCELLTNVFGS